MGKKVCVIGGNGFVGAELVKQLLQKGYAVNTTVRNLDNPKKISHLGELKSLGELGIFEAHLTEEKFDAPIAGCEFVFHVAAPTNFHSTDPENELIKPAMEGVLNVLKACARAKVKRVILTSSAAAVTINSLTGTGFVMDEAHWTNVEFLTTTKPPTWGYPVSKVAAEKAAWKFAEENEIDLITVIPTLIGGASLTPQIPSSLCLFMSLITGNDGLIKGLKGMQILSGSISLTHVQDVCAAQIFLAQKQSASGRYICCSHNTSVPHLANFLTQRYPQFKIPTHLLHDCPSKAKLIMSSEKLIKEGFSFKFGIEEIYDHTLDYFKTKGVLNN